MKQRKNTIIQHNHKLSSVWSGLYVMYQDWTVCVREQIQHTSTVRWETGWRERSDSVHRANALDQQPVFPHTLDHSSDKNWS